MHILFVVHHTFNATLTERLQQNYQYSELRQVGNVYSCFAMGCWLGSRHGCFGFANRDATFAVARLVYMFSQTFLGPLFMYLRGQARV